MGILCQDEAIQRVLASDLPHALQTLWIMYVTHEDTTASGLPGLTVTETANQRGVGRSTVSRQRNRLRQEGWMTADGRLTIPDSNVSLYETSGAECGDVAQNETSTSSRDQGGNVSCSETSENVAYSATSASGGAEAGDVALNETTPENGWQPGPSSPAAFPPPPKKDYHSTPLHLSTTPISRCVVEKISTASTAHFPGRWLGGLPPGHDALAKPLPRKHPARSERHLRYRKAAEWSLRLLEEAEDAIESFRLPSAVRRKAENRRLDLLQQWADVFRLLQEQDDLDWKEVRYAIHWLFTESDWLREGYIASIGTLRNKTQAGDRTKFEAILNQARADTSYDGPRSGGSIGDESRDESPAERFERNRRAARRAVAAK